MEKEKRYFEWIDGDDKGKVVTLDYIDIEKDNMGRNTEIYYFDNGDSCPKEFISPMTMFAGELKKRNPDGSPGSPKFMVELDTPTNVWTFAEVKGHTVNLGVSNGSGDGTRFVAPLEDILADGNGKVARTFNIVPPKNKIVRERPLPKASDYPVDEPEPVIEQPKEEQIDLNPNVVSTTDPNIVPNPSSDASKESCARTDLTDYYAIKNQTFGFPVAKQEDDPVSILVSTSKKVEKEVNMKISLMLPSKDLYSIASTNFEDGESKFINNIVKDIDVSSIIEALRDTLLESYRNATATKDASM